eukprot:6254926-Prymnesium_polylepis.1
MNKQPSAKAASPLCSMITSNSVADIERLVAAPCARPSKTEWNESAASSTITGPRRRWSSSASTWPWLLWSTSGSDSESEPDSGSLALAADEYRSRTSDLLSSAESAGRASFSTASGRTSPTVKRRLAQGNSERRSKSGAGQNRTR